MSGDILEKWIVIFDLGVSAGSFYSFRSRCCSLVGAQEERALFRVSSCSSVSASCEPSPVMPEERVLSSSVFSILAADVWIFLQQHLSCCCCSPLFSVSPNSDDEEMLISEEEVPFKDDPRDETYKPHLEKYIGLHTYLLWF